MKLYKIRDWSKLFENNRSRTVERLAWVAIPNRHDGENYSALITSKDGAELFAAWCLIVQVASIPLLLCRSLRPSRAPERERRRLVLVFGS